MQQNRDILKIYPWKLFQIRTLNFSTNSTSNF